MAIVAFIAAIYVNGRYVPSAAPSIDLEEFASEASDRIYRNETYRFGFQFPKGWTVQESGTRVEVIAPALVQGRNFLIEVTELSSDEYKSSREAAGSFASVFDEQEDYPGYEQAELFKVTTQEGTDDTILFVRQQGRNYVLNFHEFNEAHQEIFQSFQFLN